jgi:hypothetical protein
VDGKVDPDSAVSATAIDGMVVGCWDHILYHTLERLNPFLNSSARSVRWSLRRLWRVFTHFGQSEALVEKLKDDGS